MKITRDILIGKIKKDFPHLRKIDIESVLTMFFKLFNEKMLITKSIRFVNFGLLKLKTAKYNKKGQYSSAHPDDIGHSYGFKPSIKFKKFIKKYIDFS